MNRPEKRHFPARIQAELRTAARNKTALVVAHRLSTVVDAHEILVLDAGRIVERGRHAELLAKGGEYARMWALQQARGDGADDEAAANAAEAASVATPPHGG